MKTVLHLLDHSLPDQSGYSVRSHAILRELARRGIELIVITGPKQERTNSGDDEFDGILYRRTPLAPSASTSGVLGQLRTVWSMREGVVRNLRERPAQIVHAHSPCLNGLAVLGLSKPFLYELRSSWEDAAVTVGTTTEGSLRYRVSRALETFVARRADEIVVICEGLKEDLIARGIAIDKITVVPNALSDEMFELPSESDVREVRARYGLEHSKVIAFLGSFFEWEGLDSLVGALPRVVAAVPQAKLLLAGGGRHEPRLRELVAQLGLEARVVFAGRIPPEKIRAFYGAADVMAYPRIPHRLTEMVTPLKPLEAMAQMRPVVASDVGGHREQIEHGKTGFLFAKGQQAELVRALIAVLADGTDLSAIVRAARERMEREHRWSVVGARYLPVYDRLIRRANG